MDILNSPEPKLQEFMLSVGSFGDVTVGDGVNFFGQIYWIIFIQTWLKTSLVAENSS